MASASAGLDPNLNLVYDKPKTNYLMPKHLRENRLSPQEASQLLSGLRAVAPHGALDKTRLDWNGLQIRGYGSRVHENERIMPLGRWMHQFAGDEFESTHPDKTQGFGDAFLPFANLVTVPSGMGGTTMHELGHAIDFNGFPANSPIRRALATMYRRNAPTLWTEHAAWSKGRKHTLDAYAANKLDPNLAYKTLENAIGAKRVGLGSYWGGTLGTAAGVGTAIAGLIALREAGVDLRNIPNRAIGLPVIALAALGGMGGIGIGNALARKPASREKIVNMMAKSLARKQGIQYSEARRMVEQQLAQRTAPSNAGKTQSQKDDAMSHSSNRRKAAQVSPYSFGEKIAVNPALSTATRMRLQPKPTSPPPTRRPQPVAPAQMQPPQNLSAAAGVAPAGVAPAGVAPGMIKTQSAYAFGEKIALNLNDPRLLGGAGGAGLGALAGGLYGAFNPGQEETVDDEGNVTTRRKGRLGAALRGALGGGAVGGLAGAGLGHFQPGAVNSVANNAASMARKMLGIRYVPDRAQTPEQTQANMGEEPNTPAAPPSAEDARIMQQAGARAEFDRNLGEEPNTSAAPPTDAEAMLARRLARESRTRELSKQYPSAGGDPAMLEVLSRPGR